MSEEKANQTVNSNESADILYGDTENQDSNDAQDEAQKAEKPQGLGSSIKKDGEQKEDEEKSEDDSEKEEQDKEEDNKEKELFGKPKQYDYSEIIPEGMELNQESTVKFNELATELNLSQVGANRVMELAIQHTQQVQAKITDTYKQELEGKKAEYQKILKDDKDIGGAKLQETLETANLAYDKFASNEIKDILAQTGLDNHPGIVKVFHELGKHMQNDNIHTGSAPNEKKGIAEIFYGNTTKK